MEQDVIKALLDAFEHSDWQEMTVTIGDDRLHVSRQPSGNGDTPALGPPAGPTAAGAAAPDPAVSAPVGRDAQDGLGAAPPAPAEPSQSEDTVPPRPAEVPDGTQVTSPSVGLFWRAPAPGAPPFVEVNGRVSAGDTVAIVEVMKLMNHVTASVSGTVIAVLPDNGEAVEFGQVLAVIDPEG
jgi:acetyl-CoA carboxylase biotin carboxyl carrier protein